MCNLYHILRRIAKGKWENCQALDLKFGAFYNLNMILMLLYVIVVCSLNSVSSIC